MPIDFSSVDPNSASKPADPGAPIAVDALKQEQDPRPPVYAWVLPVAGLAGLVGVFLPWFHGYATSPGHHTVHFHGSISSWDDGRIGLLPGLLLAAMGFASAILLTRPAKRRHDAIDTGPVAKAAKQAAIAGGVSLACLFFAYLLVPHEYRVNGESWAAALADVRSQAGPGVQFHRGPELGFWLTLVSGVIALVVGIVLMLRLREDDDVPDVDSSKISEDGWALPTDTRRAAD